MKLIPVLVIIFAIAAPRLEAQQALWDSLNIQYRLVHNGYHQDETIIKIKVPPYLSTREVLQQIKLATAWPGDPPPKVRTKVYVFREDAPNGSKSATGAVYTPGKGFQWDLDDWEPDLSIFSYTPSVLDKVVYNTLMDSMFAKESYSIDIDSDDNPVKKQIASQFAISVAELDSIYFRVKWWNELQKLANARR